MEEFFKQILLLIMYFIIGAIIPSLLRIILEILWWLWRDVIICFWEFMVDCIEEGRDYIEERKS